MAPSIAPGIQETHNMSNNQMQAVPRTPLSPQDMSDEASDTDEMNNNLPACRRKASLSGGINIYKDILYKVRTEWVILR